MAVTVNGQLLSASQAADLRGAIGVGAAVPGAATGVVLLDGQARLPSAQLPLYTASGTGAVARAISDKLAESVSVKDFGAIGNGVADDTAAIQRAIDAVAATGGVVMIPSGTYKLTAKLSVTASNITLQGAGADANHDVGASGALAATKLVWAGAADGTMIEFTSTSGAGNPRQFGGGAVGIYFGCASSAGIGLAVKSWGGGRFERLHFDNPKDVAIEVSCVATLGEAADSQRNRFVQCSARCLEAATGGLLRLDGTATANASLNYFESLDVAYVNGIGYNLKNCDNNVFVSCRAYRASGTGAGLVFAGSNTSAGYVARGNMFVSFSGTADTTIIARGTSSFTYASANNTLMWLDVENGTPDPTIETGATAYFTRNDGLRGTDTQIGAVFGEATWVAANARAARGSGNSVYIGNNSNSHMILATGDVSKWWGAYVDASTGALWMTRGAGSGGYGMTLSAIGNYADDTAAATGGVAIGQFYRTGSALKMRVA